MSCTYYMYVAIQTHQIHRVQDSEKNHCKITRHSVVVQSTHCVYSKEITSVEVHILLHHCIFVGMWGLIMVNVQ